MMACTKLPFVMCPRQNSTGHICCGGCLYNSDTAKPIDQIPDEELLAELGRRMRR